MAAFRTPNFEEFTRYAESEIYRSFGINSFAETFRHRGRAYDRPFYGDGGLTPPVGAWAGPGDKLLAAICRVEDEAFNIAAVRSGLLKAVNRMRNDGRQVFDCRLGPGGVYHSEDVLKGAQLGLTAWAENVIGYWMKANPAEIIKMRFAPNSIRTPRLRRRFRLVQRIRWLCRWGRDARVFDSSKMLTRAWHLM